MLHASCNFICSQTATTILPLNYHLYIATRGGNIFELNLNDKDFSCKVLAGGHQLDMVVNMFALNGRMNTKGFLSNIGTAAADDEERELLHHIPCSVLLGMGAGYEDLFHHDKRISNPPLYFTTWVFPLP